MEELDPPPAYAEVEETRPLTVPNLYPPHRSAGDPRTSTVTRDQCAAHLKFLGALEDLRETISIQDGLFGVWDADAGAVSSGRTKFLARIREKRWAVYTSRAVDRYWVWWLKCVPNSGPRPKVTALQKPTYDNITFASPLGLDRDFMPPLGRFRYRYICMITVQD